MAVVDSEINFEELTELPGDEAEQAAETQVGETVETKATEEVAKEETEFNPDELFKEEDAVNTADPFKALGITAENVGDVAKRARAFDVYNTLMKQNPSLLLAEMEKANPEGYETFMDEVAKNYEQRFGGKVAEGQRGQQGNDALKVVLNKIQALEQKLSQREQVEENQSVDVQIANARKSYEGKRDELIGKIPNLSTRDTKAIRALANQELAGDFEAQKRIAQGQTGDIARILRNVAKDYFSDLLAENAANKLKRDGVVKAGTKPTPTGAAATGGEAKKDDWDGVAKDFADSLLKVGKK